MPNLQKYESLGVFDLKGRPVVSSRYVAETFEKSHKHVIRNIEELRVSLSKIGPSEIKQGNNEEEYRENGSPAGNSPRELFLKRFFVKSTYKDNQNKKQPEYLLTRDGFTLLAMGFTGNKAMQFKVAYINRFNEMEQFIKSRQAAKQEFPYLTEAITQVYENPKRHHYINECNLLNRVALGMDAKKFKETKGLKKTQSIRPYLSPEQMEAIAKLQRADIGLVISEPDYQKRKMMLEWYYDKINTSKKLIG